uniref:Uncharacterized protein n=1 Tax=Setaria italica TaxID=4555 RepID=K3YWX0_SETIT
MMYKNHGDLLLKITGGRDVVGQCPSLAWRGAGRLRLPKRNSCACPAGEDVRIPTSVTDDNLKRGYLSHWYCGDLGGVSWGIRSSINTDCIMSLLRSPHLTPPLSDIKSSS